jgi:phage terminase small subunit
MLNRLGADKRYISFAEHFMGDCLHNVTLAAKKAGYSEKTAHVQGSKLLTHPKVQARIQQIQARQARYADVKKEEVISELVKLGFSNMQDFLMRDDNGQVRIDLTRLTRDQAAAIQEFIVEETEEGVTRTKFKLANKKEALELLGKHLNMFGDGAQVNLGVQVILMDVPRPGRPEGNPPPELPEKT